MSCGHPAKECGAASTLAVAKDEAPTALLADPSVRHADAFDRDARKAYDDYRSWLAARELVSARYPLFAAELDDVFAEADFLLALRAEAAHRYGVYSHGFTAATVARFRGRLGDDRFRAELASLFAVGTAELEGTLAAAYGSVKTNPHRFDRPPTQLFPEKGAE